MGQGHRDLGYTKPSGSFPAIYKWYNKDSGLYKIGFPRDFFSKFIFKLSNRNRSSIQLCLKMGISTLYVRRGVLWETCYHNHQLLTASKKGRQHEIQGEPYIICKCLVSQKTFVWAKKVPTVNCLHLSSMLLLVYE